MGEPTDLAEAPCGLFEVEIGEGMCIRAAGGYRKLLEQVLANQMGWLSDRRADADVDARFAEIDGQELRVAIGEVQQRDVAEGRQLIGVGAG